LGRNSMPYEKPKVNASQTLCYILKISLLEPLKFLEVIGDLINSVPCVLISQLFAQFFARHYTT
jgi:hypothetical protein